MKSRFLATTMTILSVSALGGTVKADAAKGDPEATKQFADAQEFRALWKGFVGFSADIEVNLDGKVSRGKVQIDYNGKARYQDLSKEAEAWVRPVLGSIVDHRLDIMSRDATCTFADDDKHHPLGRAVLVLNDELHSIFRVKDNQIRQIERTTKDQKFTVSVLEYSNNAEGKCLPVIYTVNYWNLKSGNLVKSEASRLTWTRLGGFDLPVSALVVTAGKAQGTMKTPSVASLTLSKHAVMLPPVLESTH